MNLVINVFLAVWSKECFFIALHRVFTVKLWISQFVTSIYTCQNKVELWQSWLLIIFKLEPNHKGGTFMAPNVELEIKLTSYLGAQKSKKAMLAAIYI